MTTKQPFLTPEDAVKELQELIDAAEEVVTVADVSAILDRVAIGGQFSYKGIKAGILETLQRANAAGGQKLNTAAIFSYMNREGARVPMPTVEQALTELAHDGAIHRDSSTMISAWGIGKDAEEAARMLDPTAPIV